jgi:hypothetical protein
LVSLAELHLTTSDWHGMTQNFIATFLFEIQYPTVDQALQVVIQKVFEEAPNLPLDQEEDERLNLFRNYRVVTISMLMKMMILGM